MYDILHQIWSREYTFHFFSRKCVKKVILRPAGFHVIGVETINVTLFQQPLIILFCNTNSLSTVFFNTDTDKL